MFDSGHAGFWRTVFFKPGIENYQTSEVCCFRKETADPFFQAGDLFLIAEFSLLRKTQLWKTMKPPVKPVIVIESGFLQDNVCMICGRNK